MPELKIADKDIIVYKWVKVQKLTVRTLLDRIFNRKYKFISEWQCFNYKQNNS